MNSKIIFILMINILYAYSSPFLNRIMTQSSNFCGSKLVATLSFLCNGTYASPYKKSIDDIWNHKHEGDHINSVENTKDYPFLTEELAKSLIPLKSRREGIVEECCYKACTIDELRSYCARD